MNKNYSVLDFKGKGLNSNNINNMSINILPHINNVTRSSNIRYDLYKNKNIDEQNQNI